MRRTRILCAPPSKPTTHLTCCALQVSLEMNYGSDTASLAATTSSVTVPTSAVAVSGASTTGISQSVQVFKISCFDTNS